MSDGELEVVVRQIRSETSEVRSFVLVSAAGEPLPAFKAGAHVDVFPISGLSRQYSLVNDPVDCSHYMLGVKREPNSRGSSSAMHGNLQEGFNKVAKYVVMPGLHSPSAAHDCIFNKDVWAKIGDKDKALLETAGKATMLETYLGYAKLDVDAYKKMKENPNNEFVTVDKSLVEAVGKVSKEWAQKQSTSNEWFKKVYEDQAAFLTSVKPLGEFRFAIGSR